jgi:hypothetical protein
MEPQEPNKTPEQSGSQTNQLQQLAQSKPDIGPRPIASKPKKRLHKGVLWGIIGAGILVVVVAVVSIVLLTQQVSQADRDEAYDKAEEIWLAHHALVTATQEYINTEGVYASGKTDFEKQNKDYQQKLDDFKSLKALRDEDINNAYQALVDETSSMSGDVEKYIALTKDITTSCVSIDKYFNSSEFKSVSPEELMGAYENASKECSTTADKLISSDSRLAAMYGNDVKNYLERLRSVIQRAIDAYEDENLSASEKRATTTELAYVLTAQVWKTSSKSVYSLASGDDHVLVLLVFLVVPYSPLLWAILVLL